ncbi:hypothetical protein SH2C18_45740 [Clostridium sediminicola]|uniref:class I SAM-dependent methyltransferase n=1 Tax=Clostridium sediminicola TaxID=3114879 RepID=UPI0031F1FD86
MSYYDKKENVKEYIKMAEGFDGRKLIKILKTHLRKGSTVLELGIGPGKDLDLLKNDFIVTGSDNSYLFINSYKEKNPDADLIFLDATKMNTPQKFNCIYSNKVLQHLTREEFKISLNKQKEVLNKNGILFHSLWYGDTVETYNDLRFTYYTENSLKQIIGESFEILEMNLYTEMEVDDSLYIVLKKKD